MASEVDFGLRFLKAYKAEATTTANARTPHNLEINKTTFRARRSQSQGFADPPNPPLTPPSPSSQIRTQPPNLLPRILLRHSLPLQKVRLLNATLLDIHKEEQEQKADHAESEEEVERGGVGVGMVAGSVYDGAGDERADERAGFADDGEEGKEEELFAAGSDFGDHLCQALVSTCYV